MIFPQVAGVCIDGRAVGLIGPPLRIAWHLAAAPRRQPRQRKGWHLVRCGGTGDLPPRRQGEDQQRQVLRQLQVVQLVASEVQGNVAPPATA